MCAGEGRLKRGHSISFPLLNFFYMKGKPYRTESEHHCHPWNIWTSSLLIGDMGRMK
jgi:hypothetical protein